MEEEDKLQDNRFRLLEVAYRWYDEIARSFPDWACRPGCSICCTSSVILTTLEAAYLWEKNTALLRTLLSDWDGDDSLPPLKMTANEQAALCIAEEDFEDVAVHLSGAQCPLLGDDHCQCYEARPLMCRMMFSSLQCQETGRAEMPSYMLSLNIACLQLLEDMDQRGGSGYLIHVLPHFDDADFAETYKAGRDWADFFGLCQNRPNPGFIVPPEDRAWVEHQLRRLEELQKKG
jgi:Fe-S-cluster containining protein